MPQINEISPTTAEEAFVGESSEFSDQVYHEVKQPNTERVSEYHHIIDQDYSERPMFLEQPALVEVHPPAWEEVTSEKKSYASILTFS